jgi:serine/threonine protein kinase
VQETQGYRIHARLQPHVGAASRTLGVPGGAISTSYPRSFGSYVLLERLAQGGMSQIDLARREVEEAAYVRFVVIKRVKADRVGDEAFVNMFKDEARITAELHHASIAQVYDFGLVGDSFFLALEFVPGVDVRTIIRTQAGRGRRVPLRIALRIVCDVLDGLGYAHGRIDVYGRPMQIVHRDVNPRNVMVSVRGEVKLIDFGVAKAAHRLERTAAHVVKGKVAYMAPEQVENDHIDHRADIFAVGLTLYELISGFHPFHGLGQVQVMNRLLNEALPDPPVPRSVRNPHRLLRAYRMSVERDRRRRYQSAEAFREDLLAVAQDNGGLATREELAAFLHDEVDPHLNERLSDKFSRYSGPLALLDETLADQSTGSAKQLSEATTRKQRPPPASMSDALEPPEERSSSRSLSRPTVVGGLAVFGIGSLTIGMVVIAVVVVVGWTAWRAGVFDATPTAVTPVVAQPVPAEEPNASAEDTALDELVPVEEVDRDVAPRPSAPPGAPLVVPDPPPADPPAASEPEPEPEEQSEPTPSTRSSTGTDLKAWE